MHFINKLTTRLNEWFFSVEHNVKTPSISFIRLIIIHLLLVSFKQVFWANYLSLYCVLIYFLSFSYFLIPISKFYIYKSLKYY